MMNIQIIAVGTIKEAYLKSGIDEYGKRLRPFVKLEITEIKEERLMKEASSRDIQKALLNEGERITEKIPSEAYTIALAIEGESCSSEEFAQMLEDVKTYNSQKIVFLIGGSHGLSETVKQSASMRLSFSKATFPHQLMRLIFLEQLYRAFMIIEGRKYHK